jgi:hypothetical protein
MVCGSSALGVMSVRDNSRCLNSEWQWIFESWSDQTYPNFISIVGFSHMFDETEFLLWYGHLAHWTWMKSSVLNRWSLCRNYTINNIVGSHCNLNLLSKKAQSSKRRTNCQWMTNQVQTKSLCKLPIRATWCWSKRVRGLSNFTLKHPTLITLLQIPPHTPPTHPLGSWFARFAQRDWLAPDPLPWMTAKTTDPC